jgi:hypothetical protein
MSERLWMTVQLALVCEGFDESPPNGAGVSRHERAAHDTFKNPTIVRAKRSAMLTVMGRTAFLVDLQHSQAPPFNNW